MLGKAGFPVTDSNTRVTPQIALFVILGGNIALWAGVIAIYAWIFSR
jgi:hypothetical protein